MSETILLVDDEDDIRLVVRRMLEAKGYLVLDARDPHHAPRIAGREPIDLLPPAPAGRAGGGGADRSAPHRRDHAPDARHRAGPALPGAGAVGEGAPHVGV